MVATAEKQAEPKVIWKPHPGSQELFLSCPIYECLYEGTRGPGKTDALLMDFAQFVGRGYQTEWKGILFRREYKEFDDLVEKSRKWFPRIFPGAKFIASKGDYKWIFPDGEKLFFRTAKKVSDYDSYHGHGYPWIGWEELTSWPSDDLYIAMLSICRSAHPGMPRHYRATCNPWGVGHHWVKARFISPMPRGVVIEDEQGRERVAIHGEIWENSHLLENDPEYLKNLKAQTGAKRQAWLLGDWDIVAGGMFGDVWDPKRHIIQPFDVPRTWRIDRSFDWGSARPYSVGWWAESDGCDIELPDGSTKSTQRGDLYRIAELYGWTGKPNEGTR
ncbi:MAG: terminase, partial [Phycisphaerae bacterium]|nr:terminase [Phycisphaerae bacterium]